MAKEKKLGITADKDKDFSEWYTQLLQQAELADIRYNIKGFVPYREWSQISIEKMFRAMSDALDKNGHMPICLPTLIPEKNFEIEADHVEGFTPDVFWVTERGDGEKLEEKYALRPTSETAFYQMYSLWIRSHRDLPYKRYQRAHIFRAEKTKMTRPFFRAREFHWIESHDAFATAEGAMQQVKDDMKITEDVLHKQFAIPHIFFERPQWDKFPGAEKTFAADALMGSGKVLQLPSTHFLGQNFAKAFDVKFKDEKGKDQYVYLTCYGPAISRIYGAMISLHGDNNGLKLPFELAPLQVVIVPIIFEKTKAKVLKKCKEIEKKLSKYSVKIDDREDYSNGWKFNYYELKGVPIRIEVGPKDLEKKSVMLSRRDTGKKTPIKETSLKKTVDEIAKTFTKNLIKQGEDKFKGNIVDAKTVAELKKAIKEQKIVRAGFCSIGMDGAKCAAKIEKNVGGFVRGTKFGANEKPKTNCIVCNKKAKELVYVAKSY